MAIHQSCVSRAKAELEGVLSGISELEGLKKAARILEDKLTEAIAELADSHQVHTDLVHQYHEYRHRLDRLDVSNCRKISISLIDNTFKGPFEEESYNDKGRKI